eukprot:395408_1
MQVMQLLKCICNHKLLYFCMVAMIWSGMVINIHYSTLSNILQSQTKLSVESLDDKSEMDICNTTDWMNDIFSTFVPLNNYSILTNITLSLKKNKTFDMILNDLKLQQGPTTLLITSSILLNESIHLWRELKEGSLYIQKVSISRDIANMARYLELSNNHCCFTRNEWENTVTNYERMFIDDIFCSSCGCIIQKQDRKLLSDATGSFFHAAKQTKTDKITKHKYQHLYDKHLTDFLYTNKGIFLEIGLGCTMNYGIGESAKIWTQLFNNVHFIEYNRKCVNKYHRKNQKLNYTIHIGDQANVTFLEEIKHIQEIDKKGFDVVIDDGGHYNRQIITSFISLWHVVNPNGLYFIEDYGEASYMLKQFDAQPIHKFGDEKPGTAQFFVKSLLHNLFCAISGKSCNDIKYIECRKDICVIRKMLSFSD